MFNTQYRSSQPDTPAQPAAPPSHTTGNSAEIPAEDARACPALFVFQELTADADSVTFLPAGQVSIARMAADTLGRLPDALAELLACEAPAYTPSPAQLLTAMHCLDGGGCHSVVVKAIHEAVERCLAEPRSVDDRRPLKLLLGTPYYEDRLLKLLCAAAASEGAPISADDQQRIASAAGGSESYNLAFREQATQALLGYFAGEIVEDWPTLLKAAAGVASQELAQTCADAQLNIGKAMDRPPYFGMAINATATRDGPDAAQLARLPSPAALLAVARKAFPTLVDPLRHMAALDPRPQEIRVHYQPDPELPGQLRIRIVMSFDDPERTRAENDICLFVAQALLCAAGAAGHAPPVADAVNGTLTFLPSALGSSNDVAIALGDGPQGNDFLDSVFLRSGTRYNDDHHFLPAHAHSLAIDQGEHPATHQVVEISHLAATVYAGLGAPPAMQFALRLQLPAHARPEDTAMLEAVLRTVVGQDRVCRNGSFASSVAVAIQAAVAGSAGSFVDEEGRPGLRCLPEVTHESLREFLAWTGLERHVLVKPELDTRCWTVLATGLAPVADQQCLPMAGQRDYLPLALREGLPAAIAYANGEEARAAAEGNAGCMALLESFRQTLDSIEEAAAANGDFSRVHAAVQGLVALRERLQTAFAERPLVADETDLLRRLVRYTALALPVLERAGLLQRPGTRS